MSILDYFKTIGQISRDAGSLSRLEADFRKLQLANIQLTRDYMIAKEEGLPYRGNQYRTYEGAVSAIDKKYNATADWGVFQTGNIIDIRSAFIIAEGVQVIDETEDESANDEVEFAKAFLSYNDLDREMAQDYAKEAEIEGKILIKLNWESDDEQVSARYISWQSKKYVVKTDPQDYTWYKEVLWKPNAESGEIKDEVIKEPYFVYKKFGGRVNRPNEAASKVMKCLSQIDDLDKALRDLREIDRLFAAPILVVTFADSMSAKIAQEDIDKMNWKIKKALCTTGTVAYIQPGTSGVDGLISEITNLAKMISGATGVPVHFLGLPDLMSNRATAENLMDLVYASTLKERQIWIGAYEEMIRKAMAIYNEKTGKAQKSDALDPDLISVEIPFISEKNWQAIEKVFLPLAIADKISDNLLLSKIPGVNIKEEMERKKQESEEKTPPQLKVDEHDFDSGSDEGLEE
jgi:hypothetical protein